MKLFCSLLQLRARSFGPNVFLFIFLSFHKNGHIKTKRTALMNAKKEPQDGLARAAQLKNSAVQLSCRSAKALELTEAKMPHN